MEAKLNTKREILNRFGENQIQEESNEDTIS